MNPIEINDRPPTLIEAALGAPRLPLLLLLVLLPLACWAWIAVMARDMYGSMRGASAWTMTLVWDGPHLLLLWAMWAVMMTGMMLPLASPVLLLYGAAARRNRQSAAAWHIYALAAGYLAVWGIFSALATVAQRLLAATLLMSPMMELTSPVAGAVLLIVAGLYQLTPLKRACLRTCQSPLRFMMRRWRRGAAGAFRMGAEHGAYCVGCCWGLMLLLFAGGVMNLAVIAALTVLVAFEKLAPFGARGAQVSGVGLLAAGVWLAMR